MSAEIRSTSPPPAAELCGRTIGNFRVVRRLGAGAMAEVYLAEQTSLRRQVALKVLKPDHSAREATVQRFQREARAAAALVHPQIVQIYEVGHDHGVHFIAQEYVPGENLRQLLARHGPPDVPLAIDLIRQIAAALQLAAERGVVHRDIKPDNILLTPAGQAKVADFGLAQIAHEELNLTQAGITLGTPLYMSPEQVAGRSLDPRSDIYSFGVTCYHLLVGRPPFDGESAVAVAMQHVNATPRPLLVARPDLPPELGRIVDRMLAKDPAARPAHGGEVLRELRSLPMLTDAERDDALSRWNIETASTVGDLRAALTARLETVMRTAPVGAAQPRRNWWWLVPVVVGVFGAALGGWTRQPALLDQPARPTRVEKLATAKEQFEHAFLLRVQQSPDAEAALHAVREYFPSDTPQQTLYVRRADQQLAWLYLDDHRHADAQRIFERFAGLDDSERKFRAFGLAGLCLVYHHQGASADAAKYLAAVKPLESDLDPALRSALEKVRTELGVPP